MEGQKGFFFSILPNPKPGSYKWFDKKKKKKEADKMAPALLFTLSGMIFIFHQASLKKKRKNLCQQTANTKATIQSLC